MHASGSLTGMKQGLPTGPEPKEASFGTTDHKKLTFLEPSPFSRIHGQGFPRLLQASRGSPKLRALGCRKLLETASL